jgi:ABC-type transporter Mla maintaining outer membrane lipid asymmetry ATPase subunit MlaF
MRKAACVARAFVNEPEMLLLDDPTTGLRGELKQKLKDLIIEKMDSGVVKHAYIATDDVDFMSDITHRVLFVGDGRVQVIDREGAAA